MTTRTTVAVLVQTIFVALLAAPTHGQPLQESAPDREIIQLRGDLYEAREGQQYTVFLLTADGIIAADPLNVAFATWLKDQLSSRFPGMPIRYVIFSHHHFDRAEGGGLFVGAQLVGHGEYNQALSNSRSTLPTFLSSRDQNDNGRFDPDELTGPDAPLLRVRDRNRDGSVTSDELYRFVLSVKITYGVQRTITLGGKHVQVIHSGTWHSPDMSVLFFPDERVLFAVDPPPLTRVPFVFGTIRAHEIYDWLHAVVPLDFDTAVFGDGTTLSRTQLRNLAEYLDALRDGVVSGYERGLRVEEIQATPLPASYRGTPQYIGRAQQITDIYRTLSVRQLVVSAVGVGNYSRRTSSFCSSFSFCSAAGAVPAGTAGIALQLRRHLGFGGEITFSDQTWSTRRRSLYDEETALRQTRTSALLHLMPSRYFAFSGGLSFTVGDARGVNVVRGQLSPTGGRHQIHERSSRVGLAGGADLKLPLGPGVGLVVPLRVVYIPSSPLPRYWPSRFDANLGIGIRVRVARSVN